MIDMIKKIFKIIQCIVLGHKFKKEAMYWTNSYVNVHAGTSNGINVWVKNVCERCGEEREFIIDRFGKNAYDSQKIEKWLEEQGIKNIVNYWAKE